MPIPPAQKKPPFLDLQSRSTPNSPAQLSQRSSSMDFVRVEKNLASLGFFTPSNKKIKGVKAKTVLFNRQVDGQRLEVKAVILPSAVYGLPVTSDQDKYLAFQKIVSDIRRAHREVRNPVGFSSAEILRILSLDTDAGKHYDEIIEWGKRMTLTGISSEGVIYLAGRKAWASDTFHVFERFVSVGTQMPDGTTADRNYVWLSDWQLENINHNHVLPVDLDTYKQLRNHIAKALVPLLQIWLYATIQAGFFEKRYRDLCQILNVTEYRHASKIREKLGPSLDELQKHRYISGWKIQATTSGNDFKVVFQHGQKFAFEPTIRRHEPGVGIGADTSKRSHPSETQIDRDLLHQLMKRGITEKASVDLLRNLQPGQQVMDQLEWGDHLLIHSPNRRKFYNPAGLYIHLIKENAFPPPTFETSRIRRLREESRQERNREDERRARLELAYMNYRDEELDHYIDTHYTPAELSVLVEAKRKEMLQQTYWKRIAHNDQVLREAAQHQVRKSLGVQVPVLSFTQFCQEQVGAERSSELLEAARARQAIAPCPVSDAQNARVSGHSEV